MASDIGFGTRIKHLARRTAIKGFPWKVFYRFVAVQLVIAVVGLASAGLAARYFFVREFTSQSRQQVQEALKHFSVELGNDPKPDWCAKRARGTELHVSLVRSDGSTFCESHEYYAHYSDYPEVKAAMRGKFGDNLRYEPTQGLSVYYGAEKIADTGWIVRVALPLARLSQTMKQFDTALLLAMLLVGLALCGIAYWSARRLVFPLGRLLLKAQNVLAGGTEPTTQKDFTEETFDEWLELETHIDSMRKDLAAKAQSLTMEQVELDTIMGAISDAILAVDPEGNPLFFNSRFELLFGGENLRKRNIKLWSIFRDPEILEAFTAAFREGRVATTKAIPLEQKSGLKNYFSLSVSPLRRQDGSIYGAVGIFHDVTQLKSAEQMRIDFVANVSHELRTPLTSIKGYVDTLIEDAKAEKPLGVEFLSIISRNSERLTNLMNDLLDLSSIESQDILQRDQMGTHDLSERVVRQLEERAKVKKQNVVITATAPSVYADPLRLEQILVNLLDNASKYTPEAGNITISWEPFGNDVLLKVWNDGPAIPLEHQPRLFERFYRVDKARSREQGGTGLGLAIVKHIMQKHEGSVWVESHPSRGTAFYCRFPGPST